MSVIKLPYKDFIKPIVVCLPITIVAFLIYHFTKGGFFDGILLTLLGISATFILIVLSVLIFKILSTILVKERYRILGVLASFFLTLGFIYFLFSTLFTIVSKEI